MSAGTFVLTGYQATYNSDQFHPIRVQPETLELELTVGGTGVLNEGVPTSALTSPISARVSNSRRSLGLNAFLVRLRWNSNVTPNGYDPSGILTVPLLNSAIRAAGTGTTGTYLGQAVIVVGTSPETVR